MSFKREISNEKHPHDSPQGPDFTRYSSESKRPEHCDLYLAFVEDFVKVDN